MRLLIAALFCLAAATPGAAEDWSRFRGPNGSGIAESGALPLTFGPDDHVIWKTPLPFGHSSPVLTDTRVYLTALRDERLVTIALDRRNGKILWEREAPRARREKLDTRNGPAAPSPAVDDQGIYVFFAEYGVIAYDHDGRERWRAPLGPFNNIYGMGASPILVDRLVVLVCDQSTGSFIVGLNTQDGRQRWKTARPEAHSGHSTPILHQPRSGPTEILVPGSFLLTAYAAATGEKVWWVRGLSFEMKATPVVSGDTLFINGFGSPENQPGSQRTIPSYDEAAAAYDANHDARLLHAELPKEHSRAWIDLDTDGTVTREEWDYYRAAMASENGMLAIRLGGRGDVTSANVLWKYHKSVPQLPSPLVYKDVLYMVNDGGIVTTLRPATGETIAQSRIKGVQDRFYASPLAGDNKVFLASERGKIAVLPTDGTLEPVALNDLQDDIYATPAISGGRIYVRTRGMLYCFGAEQSDNLFAVSSHFWVNLHHYLHALARTSGPLVESLPGDPSTAEKEQWAAAVQQYRDRYGKRSLLFDEEMVKANVALAAASDTSLDGAAIAPEQRAILESVERVYRARVWPTHDEANREFMSAVAPLLKEHGQGIAGRLARTFDTSWPAAPIRVELVHDAGPPGNAYTVSETAVITIAAADPRHHGYATLEALFHEASHVWDAVLMKDISEAAKRLNVRAPRDLWHGLLFYNAGTIVSEVLAAAGVRDYQMYMEKQRMFDRAYGGMRAAMVKNWSEFLAGRVSRAEAIERILRELNLPPVK